jgi:hypothetical protein
MRHRAARPALCVSLHSLDVSLMATNVVQVPSKSADDIGSAEIVSARPGLKAGSIGRRSGGRQPSELDAKSRP